MKAKPTTNIGQITMLNCGEEHVLAGWAHRVRRQKARVFVEVRSQQETLQVVFEKDVCTEEVWARVQGLHREDVIAVHGKIVPREAHNMNSNVRTGNLEMQATDLEILNVAKETPLPIDEHIPVDEQVRLRHRYLDLRNPRMQRNIRFRAELTRVLRRNLENDGFVDIETPILANATPEGARDFLVPSRLQRGTFYALPQSPQQFKQLLMVAGIERYYQIARCFRDEDSRGDRQPEFTQLDIEMSFVDTEDIIELVSGLLRTAFETLSIPYAGTWPIPRLTYTEALTRYGSDKPDTRFGLDLMDMDLEMQNVANGEMPFGLKEIGATGGTDGSAGGSAGGAADGGRIVVIRVPRQGLEEVVALRQRLTSWVAGTSNGNFEAVVIEPTSAEPLPSPLPLLSPAPLAMTAATGAPTGSRRSPGHVHDLPTSTAPVAALPESATWPRAIASAYGLETGELLVVGWGSDWEHVSLKMGELRLQIADHLGLRDPGKFDLVWVTHFPLLEWNEQEARWDPVHHPFTSPLDEDLPLLATAPAKVRAKAYDIVMQGVEIGGGSIRIHRRDIQEKLFELIGMDSVTAQRRFGHMLEAFEYGTPPHGGIALGIDRIAMLFLGEASIREVIAFPKTSSGVDLMTSSPSEVLEQQLKDVHIRLR
jgi:aspartyl-tRNA synthetase